MTKRDGICVAVVAAMAAAALMVGSCGNDGVPGAPTRGEENARPAGPDGWLTGTTHEKFDTLAEQLRGFDLTMMEVGYRYVELYWAGEDQNWPYAAYQVEEMRGAIEAGLQRRPARARSMGLFLNTTLPDLEEAIEAADAALFARRFRAMTTYCNLCHQMEEVPFIHVQEPTVRYMPIGTPPSP